MPTKRSISTLKSKLLQPALTSHFEVSIPSGSVPNAIKIGDKVEQDDLNLFCTEATLPGSSVNVFEVNNDYTGVTEKFAHRKMYDGSIDFTFYVDAQNYSAIRFFERWMRYTTGEEGSNRDDGEERKYTDYNYNYRIRYPDGDDGYRCEGLTITKFERSHKSQLVYNFVKSFPIAVSSMPVSYDASNLLKCTVTMSYLRYFILEALVKDPPSTFLAPPPPLPPLPAAPELTDQSSDRSSELERIRGAAALASIAGSANASRILEGSRSSEARDIVDQSYNRVIFGNPNGPNQ
tara:strand:- start:46 stop:921 length:876 start_codon:yes stop_codon:yes gene_type:complete